MEDAVGGRQDARLADFELAQRCVRGDRHAQHALYEKCSDRVFRLHVRMTPNREDALELAQETFVRIFEKIHTFDGTSSLMTWVYRIAVNEALQFRRRQKLGTRVLGRIVRSRSEISPAPSDHARLDVLEALARLPVAERTLLVLRYIEGMTYEEMAAILARPSGSIASGLNRARRLLRRALEGDSGLRP